MNRLIEKLVETAPLYVKYMQQEIAVSISDKEKYIALYETENLKFPFTVGTTIESSGYTDVLKRIEKTGETVVNFVPKEVTGSVPMK